MSLKTIATFSLGETKIGTAAKSFVSLNVARGSVLDFSLSSVLKAEESSSPKSSTRRVGAIVNAANERCLGGGGVDGAIGNAGGPSLLKDREALPLLSKKFEIRCHTGSAVVTGPGRYGTLGVKYVVHAVGPAYFCFTKDNDVDDSDENDSCEDTNESNEFDEPDNLLYSAYRESLERCRENGITDVAFSLLSAGIFRGKRSLDDVLALGVIAIRDWVAEQEAANYTLSGKDSSEDTSYRLRSVTLCAFSKNEVNALTKVCRIIFRENNACKRDERKMGKDANKKDPPSE